MTGPALLTLPVFVLVILLLKVDHSPYIAEIVDYTRQNGEKSQVYVYRDITDDGIPEQILVYNLPTNGTIISYNQNGTIFESWNLYGSFYNDPVFGFNDLEGDGIQELYTITINHADSVFVSQTRLEAATDHSRKKFVTKLERFNSKIDVVIEELGFSDITGDSIPEYLFTICAGFSLQPRAVYAWDLQKDRIIRSPLAGIAIKYTDALVKADVDGDSVNELFLNNSSTDNYKLPIPFSDTASYSLVLTKNLQFLYEPIPVADQSSATQSFPLMLNDTTYILTIPRSVRQPGNDNRAFLFDMTGNKIDSMVLTNMNTNTRYYYLNEQIIFTSLENDKTVIGTIENDLSVMEHSRIKGASRRFMQVNLDDDPRMEMVSLDGRNGLLHILQDDLKTVTSCQVPYEISTLLYISVAGVTVSETNFLVQMQNSRLLIRYRENPYFAWRFVYYVLLYGLIYLVMVLLQKIFVFRSNRKKEMENRMINLQMQSVMNQLNPHFTFNTINTVGDSILNDNKHKAYENLTKLSELIRSSMDNAFQVHKSLGEEIEFTRQYLELESVRFSKKLSYTFNIDSNLDLEMKVPKMLIHLFVENSIKHGIFHKSSPGHISVTASKKEVITEITVTDDGIGRTQSKAFSRNHGKGLEILKDYLLLFRKNYNIEINYTMEDLFERVDNPGTVVRIWIKDLSTTP